MGALDVPVKPYITAAPSITNPTIVDSTVAIVGISRDRKVLFGAPTTAGAGALYTSIDEGQTWSANWLNGVPGAQVLSAVETDAGEIIMSTWSGGSPGQLRRTSSWKSKFAAGSIGTVAFATVLTAAGSGQNHFRANWCLQAAGDVLVACEYGAQQVSPSTNNARYGYLSKDDGRTWVQIFDLYSMVAGVEGAGLTAQNGFHTHGIAFDRWSGRVWLTHGDNNDGIWYSDDAAAVTVVPDASITSASQTITVAATTRVTFSALDIGKAIVGVGIPAGATISGVSNGYTATMSAPATATTATLAVRLGDCTWKRSHFGRGAMFQSVGILPTRTGLLLGSDGYPDGVARVGRTNPRAVESVYNAGNGATTYWLQMAHYQALNEPEAPSLWGYQGTQFGDKKGALVLVHPDGERGWKVWTDTWATEYQSFINVFHTYAGNIVGTLQSTRTASGYQTFRAPMPAIPS